LIVSEGEDRGGAAYDFKNLKVWQAGMDLVEQVYRLTEGFPKHELYGLAGQMQRAAISVPSNIAEGHARDTKQEYWRGLVCARGSMAELETQLLIAVRVNYLPGDAPIFEQLKLCYRLLYGLMQSVKKRT
jgi:four helix bundle protein